MRCCQKFPDHLLHRGRPRAKSFLTNSVVSSTDATTFFCSHEQREVEERIYYVMGGRIVENHDPHPPTQVRAKYCSGTVISALLRHAYNAVFSKEPIYCRNCVDCPADLSLCPSDIQPRDNSFEVYHDDMAVYDDASGQMDTLISQNLDTRDVFFGDEDLEEASKQWGVANAAIARTAEIVGTRTAEGGAKKAATVGSRGLERLGTVGEASNHMGAARESRAGVREWGAGVVKGAVKAAVADTVPAPKAKVSSPKSVPGSSLPKTTPEPSVGLRSRWIPKNHGVIVLETLYVGDRFRFLIPDVRTAIVPCYDEYTVHSS